MKQDKMKMDKMKMDNMKMDSMQMDSTTHNNHQMMDSMDKKLSLLRLHQKVIKP